MWPAKMKADWPYSENGQKMTNDRLILYTEDLILLVVGLRSFHIPNLKPTLLLCLMLW